MSEVLPFRRYWRIGDRGCRGEDSSRCYKKFVAKTQLCRGVISLAKSGLQNRSETSRATAMFDLPTLLAKIPDEYKPLVAFGIGSFMLVTLAMFHGLGLHLIFLQQKRRERRLRMGRPHVFSGIFLFGLSVFLMLGLHIVEILLWSSALTIAGFIKHAADAVYFCANAYTTLGMGILTLAISGGMSAHHWHLRVVYFCVDHQCPGGCGGVEWPTDRTTGGRAQR